jgi:hypothetical protein
MSVSRLDGSNQDFTGVVHGDVQVVTGLYICDLYDVLWKPYAKAISPHAKF